MTTSRAILVFSAVLALPALADDASPAPAPTPAAPAATKAAKKTAPKSAEKPAAGAANVVVTRDGETGELRPATPEERERLLGRQPLAAPEPVVEVLPDGTRRITLDARSAHWAAVTRNPDGTLSETCTTDPKAAPRATAPAAK